jgi:hypothetical protein
MSKWLENVGGKQNNFPQLKAEIASDAFIAEKCTT